MPEVKKDAWKVFEKAGVSDFELEIAAWGLHG